MLSVETNYNIATFTLFIVEIFAFKSKQLTASSFKLIRFVICKNAESFGIKDIKLRRRKDTLLFNQSVKIVCGLCSSAFSIFKIVLHFYISTNSDKLELLNKRLLRVICNDRESTYHQFLDRVATTSLCILRVQNVLITTYKCLHYNLYPKYHKE